MAEHGMTGLDRTLSPRSIALVGASNNEQSLGGWVFANLARAFDGPLYPVHPHDSAVQGRVAYPTVTELPEMVDLVVVMVPAPAVPKVIDECAAKDAGGALIIASGFAEVGQEGAVLQEKISVTAKASGLRVIGPNCIGFMNALGGVMANFALPPSSPLPVAGPVALVSQSGGFGSYITTKALLAGLRLGWFISTGNESDVNIATVLRHLVEREETRVLMAFSETLRDPEVFLEAARRATELDKPLILLKAGRSEAAAKAAISHTASIVGSARVLDAIARQYGVFVVSTMEEMLDLGMIFQDGRRVRKRRVGIMTTSGGAGVLLADACTAAGLEVPELPAAEQRILRAVMPEPFYGSTANPVDTTAQVVNVPGVFEQVLNFVGASDSLDMLCPVTWAAKSPTNDALIDFYQSSEKPLAVTSTAWMDEFQQAGVPTYTDPHRAANALGAVARQSLDRRVRPAPTDWSPDAARITAVRRLLGVASGRAALLESTSKEVLAAYGAPVTREEMVHDRGGAVAAARHIGGPVALKVMSYDLPHKTEAGAVRLGILGEDVVGRTFDELLAHVAATSPGARVEGVLVQEMVPARLELSCGLRRDPVFGPIVALALGGTIIEIISEAVLLRPPFDEEEARVAVSEMLDGRLVTGTRGLTGRELAATARLMAALGQLGLELPEVGEVDVNPVRVADDAVRAADALVVLGAS
jgi:acetyltransferase